MDHAFRAVILTALPVEYVAVRHHLENDSVTEDVHEKGTVYERGDFRGQKVLWNIFIVEVGAGNEIAAVEMERAIAFIRPDVALFVGIAGGLKDLAIGDVVLSTKVYGYEAGKAVNSFMPRPNIGQTSYALEQRGRVLARNREWIDRIADLSPNMKPKALVGPIAAGEKVVGSTKSATYKFLKNNYGDSLAVEMEGRGALRAAWANSEVDAAVIRGISDLIDEKTKSDFDGSQEIASRHAAAFAFQLLFDFDPGPQLKCSHIDTSKMLVEYAVILSGTFDEQTVAFARAAFDLLKSKSGDATLTLKRIERGSIRMSVVGTLDGFRELKRMFKIGQLERVAGFTVNDVQDEMLLHPAQNGHVEAIRMLIDAGAEINSATQAGMSPIIAAAQNGHLDVARMLIYAGADINSATQAGMTPIIAAAQNGHLEVVRILINVGADINFTTLEGATPLIVAARNGHVEIVRMLIHAGADLSSWVEYESGQLSETSRERSPLDWVAIQDNLSSALRMFGDRAGQAKAYRQLGTIAQGRGDYEEALRFYQQSLAISDQIDDLAGQAHAYCQMGMIAYIRNEYEAALHFYHQYRVIAVQRGDRVGEAEAYHRLGMIALGIGDYEEALRFFRQALAIAEQIGDRAVVAKINLQLGMIAQGRGDYDEALRFFRQALAIAEQIGDRAVVAKINLQLGMIAQGRGDYDEALRFYHHALAIAVQIGDRAGEAKIYHQLGMIAQGRGDYDEALRSILRSFAIHLYQQSPEMRYDLVILSQIKRNLSPEAFNGILAQQLDSERVTAVLDQFEAQIEETSDPSLDATPANRK